MACGRMSAKSYRLRLHDRLRDSQLPPFHCPTMRPVVRQLVELCSGQGQCRLRLLRW